MMNDPYPVVILKDRYGGVYSHGAWTAWPLYLEHMPRGPEDGDAECDYFWHTPQDYPIGKGATPDEALADLVAQVERAAASKPTTPK